MAMKRLNGYFILADGSISINAPSTGYCGVIAAASKKEAEMAMPYVDFKKDVFAEIRVGNHRILFLRSGALTKMGMLKRLFLGMDSEFPTEIVAAEPSSIHKTMAVKLGAIRSQGHKGPIQVAIPKRAAIDPFRLSYEISNQSVEFGSFPFGKCEFFRCSTIPKHAHRSIDDYPETTRINVATELL